MRIWVLGGVAVWLLSVLSLWVYELCHRTSRRVLVFRLVTAPLRLIVVGLIGVGNLALRLEHSLAEIECVVRYGRVGAREKIVGTRLRLQRDLR